MSATVGVEAGAAGTSTVTAGRRSGWHRRLALAVPVAAAAAVGWAAVHRHDAFVGAVHAAPIWLLLCAVGLQLVALLARCEAWHVCIAAAGSTVPRRGVFRAAGIGGIGTLVNGQVGVATRIATLRRSAPAQCPGVGALIAAEVPILAVEAALAALTSFTLLGPLGLPWWSAPLCVAAATAAIVALSRLARHRTAGVWRGLAVMASLRGRGRIVGFVLVAVAAQIARNWLALHAIGVNASVFDAIAVLIAMVTLSQLPIGPSVGAAAVVVVLGAQGVGLTAAAGVLLTATGTAGGVCFAGWALADRTWQRRLREPLPAAGPL